MGMFGGAASTVIASVNYQTHGARLQTAAFTAAGERNKNRDCARLLHRMIKYLPEPANAVESARVASIAAENALEASITANVAQMNARAQVRENVLQQALDVANQAANDALAALKAKWANPGAGNLAALVADLGNYRVPRLAAMTAQDELDAFQATMVADAMKKQRIKEYAAARRANAADVDARRAAWFVSITPTLTPAEMPAEGVNPLNYDQLNLAIANARNTRTALDNAENALDAAENALNVAGANQGRVAPRLSIGGEAMLGVAIVDFGGVGVNGVHVFLSRSGGGGIHAQARVRAAAIMAIPPARVHFILPGTTLNSFSAAVVPVLPGRHGVAADTVAAFCNDRFDALTAGLANGVPFCFPSHPFEPFRYERNNNPFRRPGGAATRDRCTCAGSRLAAFLRMLGLFEKPANRGADASNQRIRNGFVQCFAERKSNDLSSVAYEVNVDVNAALVARGLAAQVGAGMGSERLNIAHPPAGDRMRSFEVAHSCVTCQVMMQAIYGQVRTGVCSMNPADQVAAQANGEAQIVGGHFHRWNLLSSPGHDHAHQHHHHHHDHDRHFRVLAGDGDGESDADQDASLSSSDFDDELVVEIVREEWPDDQLPDDGSAVAHFRRQTCQVVAKVAESTTMRSTHHRRR